MDNFVVYAYCRENGTFYYIGKGRPRRPYGKRREGIKPPKDRDRILILHSGLTEQTAFDYEEKLILFYGRKDLGTGLLRNMTNGGEGVSGWIPDEEWRKKKSESMRGEGNPAYKDGSRLRRTSKPRESMAGENNPMYGKPRPDLASRNKEGCPSKGTKWYNNGQIDKRFVPGTESEGFVQGRLLMVELNSRGSSLEALKKSRNQVWESTMDGFRGNAANVSRHNKANGWDPKARVRVS
jgi:hypothetical protein